MSLTLFVTGDIFTLNFGSCLSQCACRRCAPHLDALLKIVNPGKMGRRRQLWTPSGGFVWSKRRNRPGSNGAIVILLVVASIQLALWLAYLLFVVLHSIVQSLLSARSKKDARSTELAPTRAAAPVSNWGDRQATGQMPGQSTYRSLRIVSRDEWRSELSMRAAARDTFIAWATTMRGAPTNVEDTISDVAQGERIIACMMSPATE